MKIVYLILAHNNPIQLKKLVDKLDYKNNSFVIHYDLNASELEYKSLQNMFKNNQNVFFAKRNKCYWGDRSLVDATIGCLNTVYEYVFEFEYAVLISGQHYPLKSNEQIENKLNNEKNKNFIKYFKLPNEKWANEDGGISRIVYYHFNKHPRERFSTKRIFKRLLFRILKKINIKRKPPIEINNFYGGSQWWCLTSACCNYIVNFIKENPEYYKYFKYVHIPDEMFFQTILLNSRFKESIINNNLTYIDWGSEPSPNPRILDETDYPKLKSSSALWARKIDINKSGKLVDLLNGGK